MRVLVAALLRIPCCADTDYALAPMREFQAFALQTAQFISERWPLLCVYARHGSLQTCQSRLSELCEA